jgi:hypothetical protein
LSALEDRKNRLELVYIVGFLRVPEITGRNPIVQETGPVLNARDNMQRLRREKQSLLETLKSIDYSIHSGADD